MKTFKKSLAVLIALVMVFSSFSVLASAEWGEERTMQYAFKFFDEYGNETTKAYVGQIITARLYMETDFVVAHQEMIFLFDSKVLAPTENSGDLVSNEDLVDRQGEWNAWTEENPALTYPANLPADFYDDYGHIYVLADLGTADYFQMRKNHGDKNSPIDPDMWTYEWQFEVISEPKDSESEDDLCAHIFFPTSGTLSVSNPTGVTSFLKAVLSASAGEEFTPDDIIGSDINDTSIVGTQDPRSWSDDFEVVSVVDNATIALGQAQGDADAADLATVDFDNATYNSPYLTVSDAVSVYYYLPNIIEDAVSGNGYANYGEGNDGDAAWQVAKQTQSGSGSRAKYYFNQNYVVESMAAYGTAPVVPGEPGILQDIPEGYYFAGWTVYTGDEEFNPADADLSFMATKPAVSATATITDGRDYSKIHGQTGNNAKNGVYSLKETLAADPNSAVMKPLIVDNYTDANGDEWLIDDEGYFVELLALILPLPAASFEVYNDVNDEEPAQTGAIEDKAAGDTVTYEDVDFDIPEGYEIDTDNTVAITLDENGGGVLKIYLKKSAYLVSFIADGEEIDGSPIEVVYGEEIDLIEVPEKTNYTGYWCTDAACEDAEHAHVPATMPAEDVTLYAVYTINAFELTFVVTELDGSETTHGPEMVSPGEDINDYIPSIDEIAGYEFSWSDYDDTMPAANTTITGSYTALPQTLTVVVDGVGTTSEVNTAETFTLDAVPEKEGNTGVWEVVNANGTAIVPDGEGNYTMPAGGATATAVYTANNYELTFEITYPNGDVETTDAIDVAYGSDINEYIPEADEIDGYEFEWAEYEDTMPAGNYTVYGSYTALDQTITYVVDGETYKTETYKTGAAITPVAAPTKAGYTFSGWSAIPETMPAGGATVTGTFTADDQTITYIVDGETYTTETYKTDAAITPVAAPTKDGYTFSGWSAIPETMPAGGATVTGTFTADDQTITYIVDGETYTTETYKTDAAITPVTAPTKAGYTFSGWSAIPETMPAGGATVTGTFTADDQTITYYVDGEVYTTETYKTDAAITAIEEPTKDGYTFSGWDAEVPATMPAGGVTLNGTFTADDQEIVYYVDGVEYAKETYKTDAAITPIEAPTKAGFTFSGWDNVPATMPAGGAVVNGTFTANAGNLTYVVDGAASKVDDTHVTGDVITLDYTPEVADGYEFDGWYATEDCTGDKITTATLAAEGTSVYGKTVAVAQTLTVVVDGEESTSEVATDETFTLDAVPEKTGYTGTWEVKDAEGNEITADAEGNYVMPAGGATATAVYTANTYELTFEITYPNGDVEATDPVEVEYGADVNEFIPDVDEIDGYEFNWAEYEDTMPATDVTITGSYTALASTLIYVLDGAEYATDADHVTGEVVTLAGAATVAAGYTFDGWYADADCTEKVTSVTMAADSTTVYGKSVANAGNLTYVVDGATSKVDDTHVTGDVITLDYAPVVAAGYEFDGWYATEDCTGDKITTATLAAEGTTVYGKTVAVAQTLTVVVDGEETTSEVATDETFTLDAVPEKTGYTGAWEVKDAEGNDITADAEGNYVMPAGGATATAVYTANTYELTFEITYPNGDVETSDPVEVEFGADVNEYIPDVDEIDGYEFAWAEYEDTMPAADTVITGSYTALAQTLTVVVDGEESTSEVATDETFTLPEISEKTGYTSAWEVVDANGDAITPDDEGNYVMPAGGATATAVYTPVTSTITIELEDGTTTDVEYTYDSEVEEFEVPEVEGKEFDYWEAVITNEDGEEETVQAESFKDLIEAIKPVNDIVVKPVYSNPAPVEYTVTYVDGDTVLEELGVYAGEPIDTIDEPEKVGYTFAGWVYTDAEGNELAGDLVMPECDLTATATWEVNEYTVTYVVDGEETDSMTVCYGEEIDTPEDPEKAGYTFVGWTYTDAEGNEYTEATMPAYDLTATAEFTADDQEIVYYVDGVEYARETYKTDAEITAIEEPTKAGYTFSGWDNVPATMPADGAEVNGTFTADDQTLTVVVDGEETTSEVATDETFTLDAVPEKTGYTGTWEVKDAEGNDITPDAEGNYVMPAGGATATAVYTANTYVLTFDADNGTDAVTSEVEFGAAIETPADPEKEGFVFLGWADAEGKAPADYDGMPANDVTFTAQWEEAANAIVKLMPADGAMSTMIERAGVVETADADRANTWATAGRRQSFYAPNGVTNVIVADAETYNYKTAAEGETYETYFVYGLDAGLKDTDLANYVTVTGEGTYEVTNVGRRGEVKTGTVISVYDKEGVLVEQFYVVIYGDVNCDGKVNASDATVLDNEVETRNWSVTTSDNYVAYITRAANLDRNTSISASDSVSINSFVEGTGNIDQSAGYYVAG